MYIDKPGNSHPAAWLAQGSAYHEAIEQWELSGRSPALDVKTAFMLSYDRQIDEMKTKQPDTKLWLRGPKISTEDDIKARRLKGVQQVLGYIEYAKNNEFVLADIDEYTLGIEVPFEIEIGGVLIKGAIDQIILHPDGYEVRDLKTGNREAGTLQLGLYVVACEKIFGWPVIKASYYYAKDDKVVTISRTELDRFNEAYLAEILTALERGIENKVFIPNPGGHCMLCPVKSSCREMGLNPLPLGVK